MQDPTPPTARSAEEQTPLSGPSSLPSDPLVQLERHSDPQDPQCPSSSSPSFHSISPFTHIPSFPTGRTATSNTRKKRSTRPYIQPPRFSSGRRQTSSDMSAPQYGNWTSNPVKYEQSELSSGDLSQAQRESSDGDQRPLYYFASVSTSVCAHQRHCNAAGYLYILLLKDNSTRRYRPDIRPNSSGSMTSSLTGAMGEPTRSAHSSPSSDRSFHDPSRSSHAQSTPTPMDWHPDASQPGNVIVAAGIPTSYYASPTTPSTSANPNLHYSNYNQYNAPDIYEQSGSFMSPTPYPEFTSRPSLLSSSPPNVVPPSMSLPLAGPHSAPVRSSIRKESVEEELRFLRNRVRELELEKETANRRLREFHATITPGYPQTGIHPTGLPSSIQSPPNVGAFQESWNVRTNARIRTFCSLNRAGNALCAWHDSRRERRAYPPRMAPPGHLNCGCTFEEALFEESLARHGVGSYHPGENVRMDPALRNPLLKLLKQRYGYKDGDFERDPITGTWVEGEDQAYWETRAQSGSAKKRSDDRKP